MPPANRRVGDGSWRYNLPMFKNYISKLKNINRIWLLPIVLVLAVIIYFIPPVHDRLAWRISDVRTAVVYFFNPPDQAIFVPAQQNQQNAIATVVQSTMRAYSTQQASLATMTPAASSSTSSGPTPTPSPTSTPLPATVSLPGVKYENQFNRWNYCGPANFSMALTFWGWTGNRDVIGKAVMPGNTGSDGLPANRDKNVMPYEFQDFISANVPDMTSLLRYGGDIDVLKRLIAGGFPVVAEKGYYEKDYTGKLSWMGHYQFITGYNDNDKTLLVQDTYLDGPNFKVPYDTFMTGWRSFDYVFVVVYPTSRDADVKSLLGPYADETWATKHALETATAESQSLSGIDQFFAWFNIGTSHVDLLEYADAASAYDQAFQLYANLNVDNTTRPYRMMWYQTGPYKAYFYSQRYQDVINLANTTLNNTIAEPVLEESLYWRGYAEDYIGQTQAAIDDFRAALKIHPKWDPALQALATLGVKP